MSSVSSYLKPFIRPEYLSEQSSPTLLTVATSANDNFIQPDHYQMQVIAEKVIVSFYADCKDTPIAL